MKLPAAPTPVSVRDLAAAFAAAHMPAAAIDLALSQWALETGWGKACFAWNLGNAKATDGWCAGGRDWTFYACNEIVNGKVVTYGAAEIAAENPGCRFRAFRSLAEGAADYLAMLQANFPRSFEAMQTGDPHAFAQTLKAEGYYTADEAQYEKTLTGVLAMVKSKLAAPSAPTLPAPSPATAPTSPERFVFVLLAGEELGERRARCAEEMLAAGSMGYQVRAPWYRSCINATSPAGTIAGRPVDDISSWATSCLIFEEAIDRHCGGTKPPPRNGAGFYEVLPPSKLRKPDGKNFPKRGDVVYVANTGTDGHVVCILHRNANGTWTVAAGGGGTDGTLCSIYVMKSDPRGYPCDHRGCQGWWSAEDLELPASPPAPAIFTAEAPTRPEVPNPRSVPPPPPVTKGEPMAPRAPLDAAARIPWGAFLARAGTVGAAVWTAARGHALLVVVLLAVLSLLAVEVWRHRARVRAVLRGAS